MLNEIVPIFCHYLNVKSWNGGRWNKKKELERKGREDEDCPCNPTVYAMCSETIETVAL